MIHSCDNNKDSNIFIYKKNTATQAHLIPPPLLTTDVLYTMGIPYVCLVKCMHLGGAVLNHIMLCQ